MLSDKIDIFGQSIFLPGKPDRKKNIIQCIQNNAKNRCYPELGKCEFFPANPGVQTNIYHYSFMVHHQT